MTSPTIDNVAVATARKQTCDTKNKMDLDFYEMHARKHNELKKILVKNHRDATTDEIEKMNEEIRMKTKLTIKMLQNILIHMDHHILETKQVAIIQHVHNECCNLIFDISDMELKKVKEQVRSELGEYYPE